MWTADHVSVTLTQEQTPAPVGSYGGMDAHATTVMPATNVTSGGYGGYGVGAAPMVPRSRADIPVLAAIPPSSPVAVKSYHDDSDEVCVSIRMSVVIWVYELANTPSELSFWVTQTNNPSDRG